MKILVIEDDIVFGEIVQRALLREGYFVDLVHDGETAMFRAKTNNYALILLDLKLPRKNGFEICRDLRRMGKDTPILMITAVSEEFGAATGLDLGADDYLRKPFDLNELLARMRSLLRRKSDLHNAKLTYGALTIDPRSRRVFGEKNELHLNPKEYKMLVYFIYHQNQAVSVNEIVENVWGEELVNVNSNSLEVYIHRLRKILAAQGLGDKLVTLRGHGYQLISA